LIDDEEASAVTKACNLDLGVLKEHLVIYIDDDMKHW
jgi:hypothetical protein